ncbi:MAG: glycosyltransferase family 4 protein [Deltaproteobacteria bacterium]|nr:glycosyltransferase family 4 protein [Deltaproteobacteria bacterium]
MGAQLIRQKKPLRVCMVGTRGFPNVQGGVEKHCERLSVHLARRNCAVTVLTRKPYVDTFITSYGGVRLVPLPAVRQKNVEALLHTFIGVLVAGIRMRPDVLHIHGIGPSLFAPLARALGLKVVLTSHGSNYHHLKWGLFGKLALRAGELMGVSFAHEVIAVSKIIGEQIQQKYGRRPVVIPNGVDFGSCPGCDSLLQRFGLADAKFILSVGRLVPEKGFDILVQSFLKSKLTGWKLAIAGAADHEDRYSAALKKTGTMDSNVVFTGYLDEPSLRVLYGRCGLFVLPSYYEGMPIALLEAMAEGASCIASDLRANRLAELEESRYFPPGNPDELAKKLKIYCGKRWEESEKKLQQARIRELHDWSAIADKTYQTYQGVAMGTLSRRLSESSSVADRGRSFSTASNLLTHSDPGPRVQGCNGASGL